MTLRRPATASVYDEFAPFYDAFTGAYEHAVWIEGLLALAREHGFAGQTVLDVACGTGKSTEPLAQSGLQLSACDISPGMVERARMRLGPRIPVDVADMRDLHYGNRFDLVVCLDDALNYLPTPADLGSACHAAHRSLRPGGLYLFDVNTLFTYRSTFAAEARHESEELLFHWRGLAQSDFAPGSSALATIEVADRGCSSPRLISDHRQRHYPDGLIRQKLAQAGLELIAVRGQYSDGALHAPLDEERHTKAIYLSRKSPNERGGAE